MSRCAVQEAISQWVQRPTGNGRPCCALRDLILSSLGSNIFDCMRGLGGLLADLCRPPSRLPTRSASDTVKAIRAHQPHCTSMKPCKNPMVMAVRSEMGHSSIVRFHSLRARLTCPHGCMSAAQAGTVGGQTAQETLCRVLLSPGRPVPRNGRRRRVAGRSWWPPRLSPRHCAAEPSACRRPPDRR